MKPADIKRIAAAALSAFDAVMSELGLDGGKQHGAEYLPLNPRRADAKPGSFSINRDSGAWADFADGDSKAKGGDLVSLSAYILDTTQTEAAERLGRLLGIALPGAPQSPTAAPIGSTKTTAPAPREKPVSAQLVGVCVMPVPTDAPTPPRAHSKYGKPAKRWAYLDAGGAVNFYHDRFEPKGERKQFNPLTLWRKPSGALEWRYKAPPSPRPIGGLDRLAAHPDAMAVVVEGEKAMDACAVLLPEHVVMCWQGGAQAVDKADWAPLAGRHVILWPDADEPGKGCMAKLAGLLAQVGAALETGDDAADLVVRGWKAEHLALLLADPGFLIDAALAAVAPEKSAATGKTDQPSKPSTDTTPAAPTKPQRFTVDERGVWMNDTDRDGNPAPPRWICSRLDVPAMVRDVDNQGWGMLVSFLDYDRKPHREIIPARDFRGEGMEVAERLLDRGLSIAPKARPLLIEYLQTAKTKKRARITSRTGWHDGVFVLPDCAFGAGTEEWLFETDTPSANTFKLKSTLAGWRDDVARLCRGNSRLVFSVSLGFASPLLQLAGAESGGFHFRSGSSDGKTTALRVAASVCGGQDYCSAGAPRITAWKPSPCSTATRPCCWMKSPK